MIDVIRYCIGFQRLSLIYLFNCFINNIDELIYYFESNTFPKVQPKYCEDLFTTAETLSKAFDNVGEQFQVRLCVLIQKKILYSMHESTNLASPRVTLS